MDSFAFLPFVDLPLMAVALLALLWHFNRWPSHHQSGTPIDLMQRLPTARRRVIVLLVTFTVLCWLANIAIWSLFVFLVVGVGIAVICLTGDDPQGLEGGPLVVAFMIREWAFGFPHFIVPPETPDFVTVTSEPEVGELIGKTGVAISTLCPSGNVEIEGANYSMVSENGQLLDAGTNVVVTSYRNGRPCVVEQSRSEHVRKDVNP